MANAISTADSAARPDLIRLVRMCPLKGRNAMTVVRKRTA
jgi:hypothetical protein